MRAARTSLPLAIILLLAAVAGVHAAGVPDTDSSGPPAAVPSLEIEIQAGFRGRFLADSWAPVTVVITNTGAPQSGEVYLRQHRGGLFSATPWVQEVRRQVDLPGGARARVTFVVPVADLLTRLSAVVVTDAGATSVEEEVVALEANRRLFLVLTGSRGFEEVAAVVGPDASLTYLRPEEAPASWEGYDGVSALLLGDVDADSYAPPQIEAIRAWLRAGGTVVVHPVALNRRPAGSAAERILGIPHASTSGSGASGLALRRVGGGRLVYPSATQVPQVVAGIPGARILAHRESDAGLRTSPTLSRVGRELRLRYPAGILVSVAAFAVLTISLLAVRRYFRIIPIAAALLGLVLILLPADDDLAVLLETTRLDPGGAATVSAELLLFDTAKTAREVRVADAVYLPPRREDSVLVEPAPGVDLVLPPASRRWNETIISLQSVRPLSVDVELTGDRIRIRNDLDRALRDVRLHRDGRELVLGEVEADSVLSVPVALDLPADGGNPGGSMGRGGASAALGALREDLLRNHTGVLLTAVLDESLLEPILDPPMPGMIIASLLWLPLEAPGRRERVLP